MPTPSALSVQAQVDAKRVLRANVGIFNMLTNQIWRRTAKRQHVQPAAAAVNMHTFLNFTRRLYCEKETKKYKTRRGTKV